MVIVASVLLLVVAWAVHKKDQITRRPSVVSYPLPWVGSAIDLGNGPKDFQTRYVHGIVPHTYGGWR